MKSFFLLLFLIFLITVISGCTQENGVVDLTSTLFGQGRGLTITNYTSTRNSLRLKETSEIKTEYKNIGGFEAKNVSAIIYGYGELSITNERSRLPQILSGLEDFMFWILKADVMGSAITSYTINSRIYYNYEFEGFKQVSFIPEDYLGDDPEISGSNRISPLTIDVQSGNPIRTIAQDHEASTCPDPCDYEYCYDGIDNDGDGYTDCFDTDCTLTCGQGFIITAVIKNEGLGDVKYKDNTGKSYKLNEITVKVPNTWSHTFEIKKDDVDIWSFYDNTDEDVKEYTLNHDYINETMNDNECAIGESDLCNLLINAMQDLWLVRGEETRIKLGFRKPLVSDVTIDKVTVLGDFSYIIDTRDFGRSIIIGVNI